MREWLLAAVAASPAGCACDDGGSRAATCGDGRTQPGEGCDDGAANSDREPDACRTDCTAARCGDGVVDTGEVCDEGDLNSATAMDSCRPDCTPARCGDGAIDLGEECDNGPANSDTSSGACRTDCTLPLCGDGIRDPGEECDDAEARSDVVPDACRTDCSAAACGDGVVDTGEECDDGEVNSDVVPDACRTDCSAAACGDGVVDAGEPCDGADPEGDGCVSRGFAGGALCAVDCRIDESACTPTVAVGIGDYAATFSQSAWGGFTIDEAIDGLVPDPNDGNGWSIDPNETDQTAVFETDADTPAFAVGTRLTFTLDQHFVTEHAIGRFRLSVTTASRDDFADGNDGAVVPGDVGVDGDWTVLSIETAAASTGAVLSVQGDSSILAEDLDSTDAVYTVVGTTALTGLTGFRLEVLEDPSLPFQGPGLQDSNGNVCLAEISVVAEPM